MNPSRTVRQARGNRNRVEVDPELSPATRRFGREFFDQWARRRYGPALTLSTPLVADRLGVHKATAARHLDALVAAGYLTVEGRAGGRRGRRGRGIVPTWGLGAPVSTDAKSRDEVTQNASLEKRARIAAYPEVEGAMVRVSTDAKCVTPPDRGPLRAPLSVRDAIDELPPAVDPDEFARRMAEVRRCLTAPRRAS